jgi:hypothetical protein
MALTTNRTAAAEALTEVRREANRHLASAIAYAAVGKLGAAQEHAYQLGLCLRDLGAIDCADDWESRS